MSARCDFCAQIAEAVCNCEDRLTVLCQRCALKHEESQEPHDLLLLEAHSHSCHVCHNANAVQSCLCVFPLPLLCADCALQHYKKGHCLESLLATFVVHSEEERTRFLLRSGALTRVESLLLANLETVETCRRDIELTTARVIETVTEWMKRKLSELDTVQEKLQRKVDEVLEMARQLRFSTNFIVVSRLEQLLQESSETELRERLTLFSHHVNEKFDLHMNEILSWSYKPSVLEGITIQPEPPKVSGLPLIFYRQLRQFSLTDFTEKTMKMKSKVHINDGSSLCLLPRGDIFVCGGEYPIHSLVYIIDPKDASSAPQPPLITPRRFAGIIAVGSAVWVFGGNDEKRSLASSEKYNLSGRGAEALADMLSPREKFSPCQWGRSLILAGGIGTTSVEVLDMDKRIYTSLPIRLPGADCTVSIMRGSELVIIQSNQLLVCDLESPTLELRAHVSEGNWWTNLQPVIYKGSAFFFRLDFSLMFDRGLVDVLVSSFKKVVNIHRASLYSLHLETLQLRELRSISY